MHRALVHTSVQSLVGVQSYQTKRVNVRSYEEQPKPMKCVYQSLLMTMCVSTLVVQDGRLTSALTMITIMDPRNLHDKTHPMPVVMSIITPFAMSATACKLASMQVDKESEDLNVTLTMDTNDVLTFGLDSIVISGDSPLAATHGTFNVITTNTLYELLIDCNGLCTPTLASFGITMFGYCDVFCSHSYCMLPHVEILSS